MERSKSRWFTNLVFMAACVVAGPGTTANAALLCSINTNATPRPNRAALDTVAGTVTVIGPLLRSVTHTNLAITNGRLYAVDKNFGVDVHVPEIDTQTGVVPSSALVTAMGIPVPNAEGLAQAGGKLYVAFHFDTVNTNPTASHAVGELDTTRRGSVPCH